MFIKPLDPGPHRKISYLRYCLEQYYINIDCWVAYTFFKCYRAVQF